ncbi:MAG TPA: hypothetical protein VGD75_20050 [Bradyrhizobium sp.]
MSESTSNNTAPAASQPVSGRTGSRRAAIVAATGALVIMGAIGWVLKSADLGVSSGDPAQPTVSFVAQGDLSAAATTLLPSAAGALIEDAQRCRVPLISMSIDRGTAPLGSIIRIRSGNYVSPYFSITDSTQRIAVPYPTPYGSGSGIMTVDGNAKGAIVGFNPTQTMVDLPGAKSIPVVWRAVSPC